MPDQMTTLAGNTGWYGLGLLGLLVIWLLFFHLPAKDKLLTDMIASRDSVLEKKDKIILDVMESRNIALLAMQTRGDALVTLIADKFDKTTSNLAADFKSSLTYITEHCKEEMDIISKEVLERIKEMKKNG